jgi:ribosomal protein L9
MCGLKKIEQIASGNGIKIPSTMMNSLRLASLRSIRSMPISRSTENVIQQQRNAHTVRVILTSDLSDGKGYAGEVHNVKAGFARNYLIPLKKALYATPPNFERAGIPDPDLISETAEERKARESMESDEDLKAADFLRHYLRSKTLKIWRMVDANTSSGGGMGAPIHPGIVDHKAVREKLAKQLRIDLEDIETLQIYPDPIPHSSFEEDGSIMDKSLNKMEPLQDGETCKVVLKALGEYLVKINLKGDHAVGLRLAVRRR